MDASKRTLVLDYLKKYSNLFSDYELSYILSYINGNYFSLETMPTILKEIYDELGILDDDINIYLGFIKMIDKEFGVIDKNIIEVGGGFLPRLGERIASMQDSGTITVYDPRLSIYKKDTEKLKLVRKRFTKNSSVDNIDLMLGLMPCKATEIILDTAIDNNIDFMIALCEGGLHGDEDDYFEDEDEWIHSLLCSVRVELQKRKMGDLEIQYMKKYGSKYPVIYNKRYKED